MFERLRKRNDPGSLSVVDPVCRMSIAPDRAIATRTVGERTIHLCSPACVTKFDRDPSAYVQDAMPDAAPRRGGRGCCS